MVASTINAELSSELNSPLTVAQFPLNTTYSRLFSTFLEITGTDWVGKTPTTNS